MFSDDHDLQRPWTISRREALARTLAGVGGIALATLLQRDAFASTAGPGSYDLSPKKPHFAPKAKSVISIFMAGGPSQMDMLDPKPLLKKYDGKEIPIKVVQRAEGGSTKVFASPFEFKKHGESGIELSELLPHLGAVVDDITVIRSGVTDRIDHDTAQISWGSGRFTAGFPTLGSWVAYGLGTENQELPAYVTLVDTNPIVGARAWTSGWLPPIYAGTTVSSKGTPMFDLERPKELSPDYQEKFLEIVNGMNRLHQRSREDLSELDSRISNYELAAKMQISATNLVDITDESEETKRLYGLDNDETAEYGMRCLLARRMIERGVRFVNLVNGDWDHHGRIVEGLKKVCLRTDKGIAALLVDLKRRGLLDSTLVIWGGEFGRLPVVERRDGRDHNPWGFSLWLAGGGVKRGLVYGSTDEFGYATVEKPVTHSDLHATFLHLLGLDHKKLTYDYEGRAESLTGVNPAKVLHDILV
jgi:hypothetical protein